MTPFSLRLCFRDPARDEADYGGERCTFVVMADNLMDALAQWLTRAEDKGATLHVVEEAKVVEGEDLADMVAAAKEGGIAAGQSYGYAPLDEPKGVCFGLIADQDGWVEVGAKGTTTGAALTAVLAKCAEDARDISFLEGFCDLVQASDEATFQSQALPMAALALSMQASGTVQFGATYARDD